MRLGPHVPRLGDTWLYSSSLTKKSKLRLLLDAVMLYFTTVSGWRHAAANSYRIYFSWGLVIHEFLELCGGHEAVGREVFGQAAVKKGPGSILGRRLLAVEDDLWTRLRPTLVVSSQFRNVHLHHEEVGRVEVEVVVVVERIHHAAGNCQAIITVKCIHCTL